MSSRIELFYTSILSTSKVRSNHDAVDRCLRGVDVTRYDIASDESAKQRWKRLNKGNSELPMILIDGDRPGSVEDLQEAVECGQLKHFLRLDQPAQPQGNEGLDGLLAGLSAEEAEKLAKELDEADGRVLPAATSGQA